MYLTNYLLISGYSYERQLNFCVPESGSNGLFHGWYVCDLVFPVAIIVILYTYMITFLGKFYVLYDVMSRGMTSCHVV